MSMEMIAAAGWALALMGGYKAWVLHREVVEMGTVIGALVAGHVSVMKVDDPAEADDESN